MDHVKIFEEAMADLVSLGYAINVADARFVRHWLRGYKDPTDKLQPRPQSVRIYQYGQGKTTLMFALYYIPSESTWRIGNYGYDWSLGCGPGEVVFDHVKAAVAYINMTGV